MRGALFTVLLICSLVAAPVEARRNNNNSIMGEQSRPTAYGLKISRGGQQSDLEPEPLMPIAGLSLMQYLNTVNTAEGEGGVYAAALSEPLQDIGRAYQAENKHREAIQFFRRALHLSRVNEGLYTETQLPLLDYMIESHLAMGQVFDVDDKQNYRFRVQQKLYQPGDPALTEAALEFSEWQRQAYLDGFAGDNYRRLVNMYDLHTRQIELLEQDSVDDAVLLRHLRQRMQAEYLLSQYEGEKEAEIQVSVSSPLDKQFAFSTDPAVHRFKYLRDFNYRNGERTMKRIIEVLEREAEPDPLELAKAQIALGDWYMWWDVLARAIQCYERAWAILDKDGSNLTNPDALFQEPVELPVTEVFRPGPITPQAERSALGTVLFDVSRQGRARNVEIVEQDPAEEMGARVALFDMLREMRFRPIVREGEAVLTESVVRVYRYEY